MGWLKLILKFCKDNSYAFFLCIFAFFFIAFVLLFYWFLYPFIEKLYDAIDLQIDGVTIGSPAFRNVSLSVAGSITLSVAVLGVILTIIRNILTRQQNKVADEQNRVNERRRITETIGQAITHIGSSSSHNPNIEVRLGGLYSLQRIMQDSLKDEEVIAKIFYAYVRHNTQPIYTSDDESREDVQAALDIIGQFNGIWKKNGKHILLANRINFSHTDLTKYLIPDMDFTNANLDGINLEYIDLSYKQFQDASMVSADLRNVDLEGANLSNVNLSFADLSTAINLTQEQLNKTTGNEYTSIPKGLKRPEHWEKILIKNTKKKKPTTKKPKNKKTP